MDLDNEIIDAFNAEGLSLDHGIHAIARQLRSNHGRQVLVGNHVENVIEDAIRVHYTVVPGNRSETGDHHVLMSSCPSLWITVESKTGTYVPYGVGLAKKNPNGRVKVGICKSRLKGIDRYYLAKGVFRVIATAYVKSGQWQIKAALVSKLARSKKYPDRIQPSQTIMLDDPSSVWVDITTALKQAVDEVRMEQFRNTSAVWFRESTKSFSALV